MGEDGKNALWSAASYNDESSARFLLAHGSRVVADTLEASCWTGNLLLTRLLIESHKVHLAHSAALLNAVRSRNLDLVSYLTGSGADPNCPQCAITPLDAAVESERLDMAALLLRRGALTEVPDSSGRRPAWYAAESTNTGFVTLLAAHKANLNARDNAYATPLMHAASLCFNWDLKALLDAGADATLKDRFGKTALAYAEEGNDPKCQETARLLTNAAKATRPTARR